jgi:hypothetical protein
MTQTTGNYVEEKQHPLANAADMLAAEEALLASW